jgi:signal peptidase II
MVDWFGEVFIVYAIAIAALVILLDWSTKYLVMTRMAEFAEIPLIPGFFSLQFVYNPGAAFGMLAHQRWLFVLITLVVIGALIVLAFREEGRRPLMPWAVGLLLGGAIGNLIDRIRWGKVVDFFLFYYKSWSFPNFNIADMAITFGVALLIIHVMRYGEKEAA